MKFSLKIFLSFLTGFEKYFPNGKNGKKASEPKEAVGEKKGRFRSRLSCLFSFAVSVREAPAVGCVTGVIHSQSSVGPA